MTNPSRRRQALPAQPSTSREASPAPAPLRPVDFRWSVVPHTHWDREWYLPFDHFRIRLARTVDEIVETLERQPEFRRFVLDGQAVILDDYAEIRPQDRVERLRKLVRDGRIAVGPAYTLPDEFLVGGEALIRNFLAGRETCRRHGAEPMRVGYLPDTFGHVAQLPQILRGFGLDTFVFWRGLDDRADGLGTAFAWRAPDGSTVAAIRQLGSYGNASQIGCWGDGGADFRGQPDAWPELAAYRFERYLNLYGDEVRRGPLRHLLLCNGSDHEPIWGPLPGLLDHARSVHDGLQVSIDTYEEFVEAARPQLVDLPVLGGEMVAGRDAPVLRGINSARIYLKQANERTERALNVAETLASLATLKGAYRYPLDELRVAWRELLKNHPHDSISGCSVDETHRDMAQRFTSAAAIAERVRREALAALAGRDERWTYQTEVAAAATIVNPLPHARVGLASLPVPEALHDAPELSLRTAAGKLAAQRDGDRLLASVAVGGWEGMAVEMAAETGVAPRHRAWADGNDAIENDHYRVEADAGGVHVLDKRTGRWHRGLHRLEDEADRGDEYNFDALSADLAVVPQVASVHVSMAGPQVAELRVTFGGELPARLAPGRDERSDQRVPFEAITTVRLVAGVDRVEFVTALLNRAEDHRLRVVFPAPLAGEPVRAEGHFAVIERAARTRWKGSGWAEPPADTGHTSGAVAVGELVVLTRGLPEYEARPVADGMELAITLLRCVGWLSRDDLDSRPGHAGPGLATPEAQCPGRHAFEYAIRFGRLHATALVNASADYRTPFEIGPEGADPKGLLLTGDPVAFSTLKRAEDGDGVVLRVHNPGREPARIRLSRDVVRLRMDEEAPQDGGLQLGPAEIATYRLR